MNLLSTIGEPRELGRSYIHPKSACPEFLSQAKGTDSSNGITPEDPTQERRKHLGGEVVTELGASCARACNEFRLHHLEHAVDIANISYLERAQRVPTWR